MLAGVHGHEKFHYNAYGPHVTIVTVHNPLDSIYKKYLANVPARIARMMLRIQKYEVELNQICHWERHRAGKCTVENQLKEG